MAVKEVILAEGTDANNIIQIYDIAELPKDTRYDIIIHTSIPIAPIFDLFLAEQFLSSMIDLGGEVLDVKSMGWSSIKVECVSDPIHVIPLIALISFTLGASVLALYITSIIVTAFLEESGEAVVDLLKWGSVSCIAAGGTYLAVKRYG